MSNDIFDNLANEQKLVFHKEITNFYRGDNYDAPLVWEYLSLDFERALDEETLEFFANNFQTAKPVIARFMADNNKTKVIVEMAMKRLTDDKVSLMADLKFWQRAFLVMTGTTVSAGAGIVFLLLRPFIDM
jgi:hypothetical protein